ncbi:hypothetical protein QFZ70_000280 [Arthrobacter sp. V1I9]|nr:hypothetical protein [Arthrobacter sp. V1I9]
MYCPSARELHKLLGQRDSTVLNAGLGRDAALRPRVRLSIMSVTHKGGLLLNHASPS